MTNEPRPPSRIPVRGTIAAVLTVGGLALLLSFRTPAAPAAEATLVLAEQPTATEELIAPTSPATPAAPELTLEPTPESIPDPTEGPTPSTQPTPEPGPTPEPEPVAVRLVGAPVAIKWGDVQVAVTLQGDDIIDVETLDIPLGDRRSLRINDRAEPILREQAIAIDTASVDVVSGATYTSRAYAASLQSALDQAGA